MRDFVNLHNHSAYSILDGYSSIPNTIKRVKGLGQKAVGLTEHGHLFSLIKFYRACKEAKIKPIVGMEAYITNELTETDDYSHITIWCENNDGLNNLMNLSTESYLKGLYRKPRITFDMLLERNKGLIISTGCLGGWISNYWKATEKEHPRLRDFYDTFSDRLYFEIQTNSVILQKGLNKFVTQLKTRYNGKLLTCCDSHYPTPEDYDSHDIICALREGKNLDDKSRKLKHEKNDYYIHSGDDVYEKLPIEEGIFSTLEITERCNVSIEPRNLMPKLDSSYNDSKLYGDVMTSLKEKTLELNSVYLSRTKHELNVIQRLGFSDYFLIIKEVVDFCHSKNIRVGPGRGSGAGSLVCYLLGITQVDPIANDLIFERFINPERISPPDLDLDFDRDRRDEVVGYVVDKFGRSRVANIITFGTMASKMAIKDVARTFGLDFSTGNIYTKLFDENESATIEETLKSKGPFRDRYEHDATFKRVVDTAKKLEGVIRQPGMHPAGIVISPDDISKFIPLYYNKKEDKILTQFDMEDIEWLGFLKMDFLGLRNLTVIQNTVDKCPTLNANLERDLLRCDDPEVYKMISKGKTCGVFQLEGQGITATAKAIAPENLEDLSAVIALYRPGAMSGDMFQRFISNKKKGKVNAIHRSLNKILAPTHGVLLYQESIMKMAVELAGFTGGEADTLRKAVAKKHMELLEPLRKKFVDGCLKNQSYDIAEIEANELYDLICQGGYGFNKSHSVAYATISYQTAYLKLYYGGYYMTELLNSFLVRTDKMNEYIKECKKLKIKVNKPNLNLANQYFKYNESKKCIDFGLNAIKGVNAEQFCSDVSSNGPYKDLQDFIIRLANIERPNTKIISSLIRSGAFDEIHDNRKEAEISINENLSLLRAIPKVNINQLSMFDAGLDDERIVKIIESEDYTESEKLFMEYESLGYYLSKHPLEKYTEKHGENIGIILEKKNIFDRKGNEMCFLSLDTIDGQIETTLFSDTYNRFGRTLVKGDFIKHNSKTDSGREGETYSVTTYVEKIA